MPVARGYHCSINQWPPSGIISVDVAAIPSLANLHMYGEVCSGNIEKLELRRRNGVGRIVECQSCTSLEFYRITGEFSA